jgi:hypothetical protein
VTEFDLGRIVGRVELDTIQFQRSYTETITRLRALRTEAQKSAVGVDDLDASFGTVSKTASTTATAISRSDRAMVGAASSASDAAVAFIAASDASAGLRAAQLGVISAQAKLNALLAAGKAGTAQYASAQAGLIRAEDRVIAVQNREAAAVEATMRARQAQAAAADRTAAQIAAAAAREAQAVERSAQRQAEADARKAAAAQRSADRVAAVNQKTAASAARATGMVVKGATLAAAVIGYESLKAAASFQQSTNVYVTAAGESVKNLGVIRKGIENIAVATGTSIENLTGAEYLVEKAGYRGAAGLKVLDAASKGAREENANLSDVVQAMTSVMASYHLTASQSVQVMNALKTGAGQAKVTMEEYAGSLSTVIPIASANHIALSQVLGALSTLTQHGTTAKEATQELAATIRALAAPNRVAQTAMQQLGLDVNDVTKNIGKRGLTGTIDLLVDAITTHMGPAGLVLQKAFNQSKTASQDAQIMIEKMPPAVAKLAAAYRDGKITLGDWRAALKELPADQAALAQQYTVVANKANGFNALLRAGDPASQTFTSALKRVSGGAIGLNTVLQLSGENMAGFKRRTDEVNKSLHDSSRDVEGWASTQKLFSVQADRAKQSLHVLGIEIGTNLLPTATKAMDWIATDGVADLRAFGSELADHRNQLVSVGGAVLGMWASWKAYKILSTVVGAVQAAGLAIKGSVTAFAALFTQSAATVEASSLAIQAAEAQSVAAVAAAEAEKASAAAESAATIAEAVAGTSSILAEGAAAAAAAAAEEAVAFQGAADAALAAAAEISAAATAAAGVAETEAAASSVAWGAMLGPVGLIAGGIAGAVLAFHAFGKSAHEQIKPTQELTQAIIDDGNAFGKLTSAMVNHTLEQKGLYDAGLKLGVSQRTLLQATLGNANAQAKVSAAILGTATTAKLSAAQHGKLTKAQNDAASAAKTLNDGLAFESKTLEVNKRAALNETAALGKSADAHKGNASAADKNAASVHAATGTTNGYLGALAKLHDKRITITARDNASSAISKVRAAIQALQSKQITITAYERIVGITGKNGTANQMRDPHPTYTGSGPGGLPDGWSSTGERGTELVHKHGSQVDVYSHAQSKAIAAATGMKVEGFASGTPSAAQRQNTQTAVTDAGGAITNVSTNKTSFTFLTFVKQMREASTALAAAIRAGASKSQIAGLTNRLDRAESKGFKLERGLGATIQSQGALLGRTVDQSVTVGKDGKLHGAVAGVSDVSGQLHQVETNLRSAGLSSKFIAGLHNENKQILADVASRNSAARHLTAANKAVLAAQAVLTNDRSAFKGAVLGTFDITSAGVNDKGVTTKGGLRAEQKQDITRARAFLTGMTTLTNKKIFPTAYLRALFGKGPDALGTVQALLSMRAPELRAFARGERSLDSLGNQIGSLGATRLDQGAVDTALANQHTWERREATRQKHLDKALDHFANRISDKLDHLHLTAALGMTKGQLAVLIKTGDNQNAKAERR